MSPAKTLVPGLLMASSLVAQIEMLQPHVGARSSFAAAYDGIHNQLVVFGGYQDITAQTWRRDANGWHADARTGLGGRYRMASAFDPARQRMVMFGGRLLNATPNDDMFEWDGTNWLQVAAGPRPSPRADAAMVYDALRQRVVLFGGVNGNNIDQGDTWVWDGVVWTQRSTVGPSPRWGHAMAYDSLHGLTVLFGGGSYAATWLGDTWDWNGTNWTQRSSTGPSRRYWSAMAFLPSTGRTVLFGGTDGALFDDTWEWDGWQWLLRPGAGSVPGRYGHCLVHDSARGVVTMFGGRTANGNSSELWDWNGTSWSLAEAGPEPSYTEWYLCHDPVRGETLAFGGTEPNTLLPRNQTWTWNGSSWLRHQPFTAPPARHGPMLCFDSVRQRVVMFGGTGFADLWQWDGSNWAQGPSGPPARGWGSFAFDAQRGRAVLFGGLGPGYLADTWEWNGVTWTAVNPSLAPSPRSHAGLGFDPNTRRLILFGGINNLVTHGDTWTFDGQQWTQLTPATPPPGDRIAKLLTDRHRGRLVMAGGSVNAGTLWYQLWDWNGADWTLRLSQPAIRNQVSTAFDANRGRFVTLEGNMTSTFVEFAYPSDVVGTGSAPLRALDRPVVGAPFRLDLGTTTSVLGLTVGNLQTPPWLFSGGPFCGGERLFLDPSATVLSTVPGPILTISIPNDPSLVFLPLLAQQLVVDPSFCLRLSDALALRIQPQ